MSDMPDPNTRMKFIKTKYKLKQYDISRITGYSINSIKKWDDE